MARMGQHANEMSLNHTDVAAAIEACRLRQSNSVLSDPLGFADFDFAEWRCARVDAPVEVDVFTRPKQSGGTRVEVVPDFGTSVELELAAGQLGCRDALQAYRSWRDTVPMWIRHALVDDLSVIVADVDSYFGSLPKSKIENVLRNLDLDPATIKTALRTIETINAIPDAHGVTRRGLPVSHDSLFWVLADAALDPVDNCLSHEPTIERHKRWVDDFFLATESTNIDHILATLSSALEKEGLRLNRKKTRVLNSLPDYERQALTSEHHLVNSLMTTGAKDELPKQQKRAFLKLVEGERCRTPEHARLWKRIYALAQHLQSPELAPAAIDDLGHYPMAADQIVSYLQSMRWPGGTAAKAVKSLTYTHTDSQAIVLLRSLLNTRDILPAPTLAALRDLAERRRTSLHPYASVLLNGCLVFGQRSEESGAVQQLLSLAEGAPSPLARRTAIELLWLIPTVRRGLVELAQHDPSPAVRGLTKLPAVVGGVQVRNANAKQTLHAVPVWSSIGSALRRTWMQAEK